VSGIRGVNSDGVLRALQDRGLINEVGREETPGRPVLFGTSPAFLERLGLSSLAALPSLAPLLGLDDEEAASDPEEAASIPSDEDVVETPETVDAEPDAD
jgi:chromosome segregation and condensation protein ScpB